MNKPTREFVEDDYFSEVLGHPQLHFLQEGVYYDAHKQPVKGQPKGNPITTAQKESAKKGRVKGSKIVDGKLVPPVTPITMAAMNVPQVLETAEKENLRAKEAEEKAE